MWARTARKPRLQFTFAVCAAVAGLWLLTYAVLVTDDASNALGEIAANRLWSPGLLLVVVAAVGFAGFAWPSSNKVARAALVAGVAGAALMFVGNTVEYWFLFELPHQGPGGAWRGIAWMTVLFGFLVVLLALPTVAIASARSLRPHFLPWVLGLTVPVAAACALAAQWLAALPFVALLWSVAIVLGSERQPRPPVAAETP